MPKRTKAIVALILTTLIWGPAPAIIKLGLARIPPMTFLFVRLLLQSIIVLPFFLHHLIKYPLKLSQIPALFTIGLFGQTFSLAMFFWAISKTSSLDAAIIGSVNPIFIMLSAVIFLRETVTRREKIGALLALIGTLIIVIQPWAESGFSLHNGFATRIAGNLLMLVYLICNTFYTILTKKNFLKTKIDPFTKTCVAFFTATVTLFPLSMIEIASLPISQLGVFGRLGVLDLSLIFSLAYMILLSGIAAYFLYEYALSKIEASEVTVFTYSQILVAIPAGFLILGEKPSGVFLIGGMVIAGGIMMCYTPLRETKHPS